MTNLNNLNPPVRNFNQIKQNLLDCGFDCRTCVSIWEEAKGTWRWRGKTSLLIAICNYEWSQANIGKRFPSSIHKTNPGYIFGLDANPNQEKEFTLYVKLQE
jgi:hypothetical protein